MLHLRSCVLAHLLSPRSASPISPLHQLLSAAAGSLSPNPSFAVEEYLVSTCGLTRPQALKASPKLSHLKSPANADAVLAFLAGLGLSTADVAAIVAKDPLFLCAKVEGTLARNVAGLTGVGLSTSQIARVVSLAAAGGHFRYKGIDSKLRYYLAFFGSFENLVRALNRGSYLISADLERNVKPNIALMQECGLADCDIAYLLSRVPLVLTATPERVQATLARAKGLGVPRDSGMFKHALKAVAFVSDEEITATVDFLKNAFRWSDAEVGVALSKAPYLLLRSKELLQHRSDFFSEVGLEPAYIARRSIMVTCSLEGRLRPRYYVVKFLKENGLLKRDPDYYSVVLLTEKVFVEKYICPHKEAAPLLAGDYADACRGKMPTRFIFT